MFVVILFAVYRPTFMLMLCKYCLKAPFQVNIFETADLNMAALHVELNLFFSVRLLNISILFQTICCLILCVKGRNNSKTHSFSIRSRKTEDAWDSYESLKQGSVRRQKTNRETLEGYGLNIPC